MKRLMIAVAVAGAVALGAQADEIEGALATGGTVAALQGGAFVHTFTNAENHTTTQSYTFEVTADSVTAEILVVGGGGAGGSGGGGGGGGGGFVSRSSVVLPKGAYTVQVGAGGLASSANSVAGGNGGDSSLISSDESIQIIAHGGGGGAGFTTAAKGGGSGGGASYNGNNPTPGECLYEGEGNVGGNGKSGIDTVSGGGGGAGGPGESGYTSNGHGQDIGTVRYCGNGGDGKPSAISGDLLYYGAGGGGGAFGNSNGYCNRHGFGGSNGVGGDGAGAPNWTECTPHELSTAGQNGRGGGGGGGGRNLSGTGRANASNGGDGCVIIRYVNESMIGADPEMTCSTPYEVSETVGKVLVTLANAGAGCDSVRLTAQLGYEQGDASVKDVTLSEKFAGSQEFVFDGLSPNRDYYLCLIGVNGHGVAVTNETSFTTQKGLDASIAVSGTALRRTFTYTLTAVGSGTTTVRLHAGFSAQAMDVLDSWTATAAGTFTYAHLFPAESADKTIYYAISVTTSEDGREWGPVWTDTKSFSLRDETAYDWTPGENVLWCDPQNWTTSSGDDIIGIPTPGGATAKFAANGDYTVNITGTQGAHFIDLTASKMNIVFNGVGTDAVLQYATSNYDCGTDKDYIFGSGNAATGTFRNVTFNWSKTGFPKFASNQVFILDGSSLQGTSGWEMHNNGVQLVLRNKSVMSVAMQFLSGHASKIVLDDSQLTLNNTFQPANDAGTPGSTVEFRGEAPQLRLNGGSGTRCEQADVVFAFYPEMAYAVAPIVSSVRFPADDSSHGIVFSAPEKTIGLKFSETFEMTLLSSAKGIAVEKVAFGQPAFENDYFYFAESEAADAVQYKTAEDAAALGTTMKYIRYHHQSSPGLILMLR